MPRVVHFEINADDPERAIKFYEETFGWKVEKWDGPMDYWLVTTGGKDEPGINGGIMKREDPGAGTVNTIAVPDIDDYLKRLEAGGGKVVTEKMSIPGVGDFAYFVDPEGNTFSVMQFACEENS